MLGGVLVFAGCGAGNEETPAGVVETELTPAPTAIPTPFPTATPGSAGGGTAHTNGLSCDERHLAEDRLTEAIEEVLTDYDGTWGFALIDLECEHVVSIHPDYAQYPASAAKIVSVVAAMRAVEAGDADLEEVDELVHLVMQHSLDYAADALEEYVEPDDLDQVLVDAGASEEAAMNGSWSWASMTAEDLAGVWSGIVEGTLVDDFGREYLLELAGMTEVPEVYETFPTGEFPVSGFDYGQKAGYYVVDGVPYYFAGGGYLVSHVGSERFTFGLLMKTRNRDLWDEQRRQVFPQILAHIAAVTGDASVVSAGG